MEWNHQNIEFLAWDPWVFPALEFLWICTKKPALGVKEYFKSLENSLCKVRYNSDSITKATFESVHWKSDGIRAGECLATQLPTRWDTFHPMCG